MLDAVVTDPVPLRVLLADDSASLRLLMQLTLDDHPAFCVVAVAADGVEAVQRAGDEKPDVVLLDIAMPRMDGLEAIAAIRAVSPQTKIVIFSGYSSDRMAAAAHNAGADAFLEKAVPDERVLETLLEICGRTQAGQLPAPRPPASTSKTAVTPSVPAPAPATDDVPAADDADDYVDLLLDALEEGVVVTDARGIVRSANFSATRIFGLPTSRLVGQDVATIGIRDDGSADTPDPITAALAVGRPFSAVDVVVRRPDGSTAYLLASVRPVRKPGSAAPHAAVASFVDITARRAAEVVACEAAARFRVALDTMLDAVSLYSAVRGTDGSVSDFVVDHANAATAAVTGRPADQLIGRRLLEVFPELRGTPLFTAYVRVVETGEPLVLDCMDHRSDPGGHLPHGAFNVRASRIGDGLVVTWRRVGRRATDQPVSLSGDPTA